MKLRPTRLDQISALVLLGSVLAAPVTVNANEYWNENEKDEQVQEDEINSLHDYQSDLQKTSQPMYDEPEEGEEVTDDWGGYEEMEDEDDPPVETEDEEGMSEY